MGSKFWTIALALVACVGLLACGDDSSNQGVCGDGNLDPGEVCDDGNLVDGDGCEANCRRTPTTLASGQDHPYCIAVDSTHVYWTDSGAGVVMKVPK